MFQKTTQPLAPDADKSMAAHADRHRLYQQSVQDVESEIDFVEQTWSELRRRPAEFLREDFCGTANTACEWIKRVLGEFPIAIPTDDFQFHIINDPGLLYY